MQVIKEPWWSGTGTDVGQNMRISWEQQYL